MLQKRYDPHTTEPALHAQWQQAGAYHFELESDRPVYSIDTPPATVSGKLHLGHVYSYSHADFIARFRRMSGDNVFYPMGYDDNGLPTDRLVERQMGVRSSEIGREAFTEKCLQVSEEAEKEYQSLWARLGLSIDWRYTYRTIDDLSRRTSQLSFLQQLRSGQIYRKEAPTLWCPECHTAIAQAELNDIDQSSEFVTLLFSLSPGGKMMAGGEGKIPIATTRPELLPACVAVFVHPEDERYSRLAGQLVEVPLFGQRVPILADPQADPEKGTGIVMCCTFGDQTDVAWWHTHHLPLIEAIDQEGRMTQAAGQFAGLTIEQARKEIKSALRGTQFLTAQAPITHAIRAHERCDTPVEYIITRQWFTRVLDFKDELIEAGERVNWHPAHMKARYRAWVENLNWDWCISRQRLYGVPFPVWYCQDCGETLLADETRLPVDPRDDPPSLPCENCGGTAYLPEEDVMDTWATSSLTPQLAGQWLKNRELFEKVFPFSLRPQAHEIIRTWAFYTIVKSNFHFDKTPWKNVLISGWGIAGEGMGKISKSRGGGLMPPVEMIEAYSADAVRYWTASTGPGKDTIISEEKVQIGAKLVNKIWNVARFSERFVASLYPLTPSPLRSSERGGGGCASSRGRGEVFTLADRWILSRAQKLIQRVTALFQDYDYAAAKAETEAFFWGFADNYLEMAKQRLYNESDPLREGAQFTLYHVLLTLIKLFAPILPHVTEAVYQGVFAESQSAGHRLSGKFASIHNAGWPQAAEKWIDQDAEDLGERLIEIATAARRYKSEHNLSLGTGLKRVQLATDNPELAQALERAIPDLLSITRALEIEIATHGKDGLVIYIE